MDQNEYINYHVYSCRDEWNRRTQGYSNRLKRKIPRRLDLSSFLGK